MFENKSICTNWTIQMVSPLVHTHTLHVYQKQYSCWWKATKNHFGAIGKSFRSFTELTHWSLHMTPDMWYLTHKIFYIILFLYFVLSVLLSAHIERFSVFCKRDFYTFLVFLVFYAILFFCITICNLTQLEDTVDCWYVVKMVLILLDKTYSKTT